MCTHWVYIIENCKEKSWSIVMFLCVRLCLRSLTFSGSTLLFTFCTIVQLTLIFFCNLIKCLTILFIEHSIQQSFSIIRVGLSVLTSVQGSNLGMLELTYQLQTFRDYSFSSQIPYRKQNNSIINKKCQQVHSKYDNCGFLDQACQKCPIDLKLGMMIPDTVWYSNSLILRYLCPF